MIISLQFPSSTRNQTSHLSQMKQNLERKPRKQRDLDRIRDEIIQDYKLLGWEKGGRREVYIENGGW